MLLDDIDESSDVLGCHSCFFQKQSGADSIHANRWERIIQTIRLPPKTLCQHHLRHRHMLQESSLAHHDRVGYRYRVDGRKRIPDVLRPLPSHERDTADNFVTIHLFMYGKYALPFV